MEEAAHSLGAGKLHIFRTVTLPLLIPGLAGSFLLLFVESLADLGNPLFISGNVSVLSAQIFLAVAGEYDYQKASALAFVLLIPTLVVFLVQRYYVTRRSYISVTGKPTGGQILVKEPFIRWPFIIITYAVCLLIVVLYAAIIWGSFSAAWGVDYTPTLVWWKQMLTRGVESILDTTFLSLSGGAQEVQREGHCRFRLQPGWSCAGHDPGYRVCVSFQYTPNVRGVGVVPASRFLSCQNRL
jgi:iron(III) transport system permease protein